MLTCPVQPGSASPTLLAFVVVEWRSLGNSCQMVFTNQYYCIATIARMNELAIIFR